MSAVTIEVPEGGVINVTDPCYWTLDHTNDVENLGAMIPHAGGTWRVYTETVDAGDWGMRVAKLIAVRQNEGEDVPVGDHYDVYELGVDAGLMSVAAANAGPVDYDGTLMKALYPEDGPDDPVDTNEAVLIEENRVVCSSGFGDGVYRCDAWLAGDADLTADHNVMGRIEVRFITDDDE